MGAAKGKRPVGAPTERQHVRTPKSGPAATGHSTMTRHSQTGFLALCARSLRGWGRGAPSLKLLGAFAFAAVCALALVPAAQAKQTHLFETTFGSFSSPVAVSVNQETERVYVTDQVTGQVSIFNADGTAAGELAGGSLQNPAGVAVDNSSEPTKGDIWVSDYGTGDVTRFNPAGVATATTITEASIPPADQGNGGFIPIGLGVDAHGNLYVGDTSNGVIDEFEPDGTFLRQLGAGDLSNVQQIAVDAAGDVFVANSSGAVELEPSGTCAHSCSPIDSAGQNGLAVDSSGHLFVTEGGQVSEYEPEASEPSGFKLLSTFGTGHLAGSYGVAVNDATGHVYVTDPGSASADIFGALVDVPPPAVTIADASQVSYTTANAAGTVELSNPNPDFDASCQFTYVTEAHFQSEGFENSNQVACEPETVLASDSQPVPVAARLTGLAPGTTYHLRLQATNVGGSEGAAAAHTFTTEAVAIPTASIESVASVTATTAHLAGHVDPDSPRAEGSTSAAEQQAFKTSYRFQCTPECPGLEGELPADDTSHEVIAEATGLSPGTEYQVMLLASNAGGTAEAGPRAFTTLAVAPSIASTYSADVTSAGAILHARVDPGGAITGVEFEYLTRRQLDENEAEGQPPFTGATSTQSSAVGNDDEEHLASAPVEALDAETSYVFRAVARNSVATVRGSAKDFTTLAAGAASEPCPNAQLRSESNVNPATERPYSTELPECRAYELVTPPNKNLNFIEAFRFAADGSRLFGRSLGAFSGGADGLVLENNGYEFARTPSGWQTNSIEPSNTEYQSFVAGFPAGSLATDTGETLFAGFPRLGGRPYQQLLFLRDPDGALTEVGPLVPPNEPSLAGLPNLEEGNGSTAETNIGVRMVAASDDLSHVAFFANPWPGDPSPAPPREDTASRSLYEYVGTGNTEPTLVGVKNVGSVAAAAAAQHNEHINEAAELIGKCGVGLGGPLVNEPTSEHNAISASGETIFFTPEPCAGGPLVDELYARLAGLKTLSISEPPLTGPEAVPGRICTGICAEDEMETGTGQRSNAVFAGASEDGSKVFFTTAQPLLDSDADATADLYMAEIEGSGSSAHLSRLVQVSKGAAGDPTPGSGAEVQGLAALSEDGSHVYFVAQGILAGENTEHKSPSAGEDNLYAYDTNTEEVAFVATLSGEDSRQWRSVNIPMQTTPDGRFLVFTSHADLTPDDSSEAAQVFRYDAQAAELKRISIGEHGLAEDGNAAGPSQIPQPNFSYGANLSPDPAITANGTTVVFTSSGALTPDSIAGGENAYEYRDGHVYLLFAEPPEPRQGPEQLVGIDASGQDIFVSSLTAFVGQDSDSLRDYYDVRVDGGFPAPTAGAVCSGDSCQGPRSAVSSEVSSATSHFNGPTDEQGGPTCVGRKVRRDAQCQKKPKRHRKKHQKAHKKKHPARQRVDHDLGGGK
jgi:hypothetical protein